MKMLALGSLMTVAVPSVAYAMSDVLSAKVVEVDPQTIIGGGGVGLLGWLAATVWRFMKRQDELQDLQKKYFESEIKTTNEASQHRELERLHWARIEHNHDNQQSQLRNIRDELRERLPSGPHTPVQGVPLSPPGSPTKPWGSG